MEDSKGIRLLDNARFNEEDGHFSPDMQWIAYVSDEAGMKQIYVRAFSQDSGEISTAASGLSIISKSGGMGPRWTKDGKELCYWTPDGKIIAVSVETEGSFQVGETKVLFQKNYDVATMGTPAPFPAWDITADGERFLSLMPVQESSPSPFNVILNWTSLLEK